MFKDDRKLTYHNSDGADKPLISPVSGDVLTAARHYLEQGSLVSIERQANKRGLRSKRHHFSTGRIQGGNPLSRGQIYALLRNPVYRGKIRHKD